MKLVYKDPGFVYSTKSIAEFIKQGEFWSEPIYHFFPELSIYKDLFNRDMENSLIEEKIMSSIEKLYIGRKEEEIISN